jgi:hypothetical protein
MRLVTPIPEAHAWRPEMLEILWAGDIAPGERADAIDRLLPKIAAIEPEADTVEAQFFKAYREALSIGAELFRWDHTVRASERDAVRHLDAAKRRAETLQLLEHPLFPPLKTAVQLVASIKSPRDSETYARAIAQVPVPVRVLARRPAPRGWRRPIRPEPEPLAVCLVRVDHQPVVHAHVVHPERLYELSVTARLTRWPGWADRLRIDLISVLDRRTVETPVLEAARPARDADGLWTVDMTGSLVLHAKQGLGARPVRLTMAATLTGANGRTRRIEILGYRDVRIRAFDPSRDVIVGGASDDERVVEMLAALHNVDIPDSEGEAYCRFFAALVRAAVAIQSDRMYRPGRVREARFQDDLERRLRADPSLGGRLERRTRASGGFTDLLHDGIVCELKVVDDKAVTLETADLHVGQPTQYASAVSAQLSILCILDVSPKSAPVGTIGEYIGWLTPRLHGRDEPQLPSHVGVIIVNGSQPRPSSWSGRRIASRRGLRRGRSHAKNSQGPNQ